MVAAIKKRKNPGPAGKLRIGDDWSAITIIALSQSNPLKAVAEFVENSIDAHARHITITRGRERGEHYLLIHDDGDGIPRDRNGLPDFHYVATHICDSIKRRLKSQGAQGIQGEFGIGLLSFWTVGEQLLLTCGGDDGKTYQMCMRKGDPNYAVTPRHTLFSRKGTELKIKPLHPGIRQFSGEKIQWYLASELRDRIRHSNIKIKIVDRHARREYRVEPRRFTGRLLHELPRPTTARGEIYLELYLAELDPQNRVGLYRSGTRVLADATELEAFQRAPWNLGHIQGIIDAPFLSLTPGTRSGIIQDTEYEAFCMALAPVATRLTEVIEEQKRAEEERASRDILRSIQRALQEALLALPMEEYDWFDVRARNGSGALRPKAPAEGAVIEKTDDGAEEQKQFFEFAGPLFSVRIAPTSCVIPVNQSRTLRAVARDRARRLVEENLAFRWEIVQGQGHLENTDCEIVSFQAAAEPGLSHICVSATHGAIECGAEAVITVTQSLLTDIPEPLPTRQGLPGYTFQHAPGELWRSRLDAPQNVIVINNGHRDFVYAARSRALKLRYVARLFAKELVLKNFPGQSAEQLLERMIELALYMEENLK